MKINLYPGLKEDLELFAKQRNSDLHTSIIEVLATSMLIEHHLTPEDKAAMMAIFGKYWPKHHH